ncbi:hypothetical protein KAI19_02850 [bacterium]|nr:hypothetical protein [bacterium]
MEKMNKKKGFLKCKKSKELLYIKKKYEAGKEIVFIESMIRPMELGNE